MVPGLDLDKLADYLESKAPGLITEPLRATLVVGGRSNLTYILNDIYVVRRPPLGHVLATAHDMTREFRVISALGPTAVPVPETLLLCEDSSVLGAPFYVMARVPGAVYRTAAQTEELGATGRRKASFAMIDTLVALHAVDPVDDRPRRLRPAGRLPRTAGTALDAAARRDPRSRDAARPSTSCATGWPARFPSSPRAAIVHGDYRLDNLIVDPATLTVAAVLDWEMATLGDPLTDLGLLLVYWDVLSEVELAAGNPIADRVGTAAGFPSGAELLERYAKRVRHRASAICTGTSALACYKLAVDARGHPLPLHPRSDRRRRLRPDRRAGRATAPPGSRRLGEPTWDDTEGTR